MTITKVVITKRDYDIPVARVKYGDRYTSGIRIVVDRYSSDIDLGSLGWSIKIVSGENSDVIPIDVEVYDKTIEHTFVFPAIVASTVGNTVFELEGVNPESEKVWQSGKRYIQVDDELDADPGYEPEAMTEFQEALYSVTKKYNELNEVVNDTKEKYETGYFKGDKGDTGAQGPQGIQGPKGEQGDKGDKGDPGIPVTVEPGERIVVPSMDEFNDLSRSVIKKVYANGTLLSSIGGSVDIPAASDIGLGLVKIENPNEGLKISPGGILAIQSATAQEIDKRTSLTKPIVPSMVPYAVKSVMNTASDWTDEERTLALKNLGINPIELICDLTLTNEYSNITVSRDLNNRTFALKKLNAVVLCKPAANVTPLGPLFIDYNTNKSTYLTNAVGGNTSIAIQVNVECIGNSLTGYASHGNSDFSSQLIYDFGSDSITSIRFSGLGLGYFGIGSRFVIYGVRL